MAPTWPTDISPLPSSFSFPFFNFFVYFDLFTNFIDNSDDLLLLLCIAYSTVFPLSYSCEISIHRALPALQLGRPFGSWEFTLCVSDLYQPPYPLSLPTHITFYSPFDIPLNIEHLLRSAFSGFIHQLSLITVSSTVSCLYPLINRGLRSLHIFKGRRTANPTVVSRLLLFLARKSTSFSSES
jgi:hypothetical protein